ncbi:MAG: GumC family protein, partial [Spirochaetota bacterium]
MENTRSEFNLMEKSARDVCAVLFRHKWPMLFIFIVAVAAVSLYVFSMPDLYQSTAKILIGGGQTNPIQALTGNPVPAEVTSEIEIVRSRGFAEKVIEKVGAERVLHNPEEDGFTLPLEAMRAEAASMDSSRNRREQAVQAYMDSLAVSPVPRSSVVDFTYQARTPVLAREILQETIQAYLERRFEIHTSALSLQFLEEETRRLKEEAARHGDELRAFRTRLDIVSLPDQQNLLLDRSNQLQTAVEETEAEIATISTSIEQMRSNVNLRNRLREEEVALQSLQARHRTLAGQLSAVREKLRIINENERRYTTLLQELGRAEESYRRYSASLEQARIARSLENEGFSNISIIQEPTLVLEPVSQEKKKTLALGLFLGLAGGVGFAFLREHADHSFRTLQHLRDRLSLPAVSAVPLVKPRKPLHLVRKTWRKQGVNPRPRSISRNVTIWFNLLEEVRSGFEQAADHLVSVVLPQGKRPYLLGVTSYFREEGVSTVATGLAYAVSLLGKKVLLVDANHHHNEEERVVGLNRPPGLYEIALQKQESRPGAGGDDPYSAWVQEYLARIRDIHQIHRLLPTAETFD